jgi:hypothetical protein
LLRPPAPDKIYEQEDPIETPAEVVARVEVPQQLPQQLPQLITKIMIQDVPTEVEAVVDKPLHPFIYGLILFVTWPSLLLIWLINKWDTHTKKMPFPEEEHLGNS